MGKKKRILFNRHFFLSLGVTKANKEYVTMKNNNNGDYNFKVVLLGEGCVGKTSCVVRYVQDTFTDKHITTLQASFLSKKLNIRGKRVTLSLWDTAGQERFHALGPIYYRDADGAILVYDITDADSFSKVKVWVKELRKMLGPDICLVIAGNKTDLERRRTVDAQVAEQYAASVNANHFHTSAKNNSGIEDLFEDLGGRMMAAAEDQRKRGQKLGPNIQVVDDTKFAKAKSSCCATGGRRDSTAEMEALASNESRGRI